MTIYVAIAYTSKMEFRPDNWFYTVGSSSQVQKESSVAVTDDDLKHLSRLVEVKDGGPSWIQMMDRSTPNMSYQAWRRDPEV